MLPKFEAHTHATSRSHTFVLARRSGHSVSSSVLPQQQSPRMSDRVVVFLTGSKEGFPAVQKALEANGYEVIVDQDSVDDYHHAAVADVAVLLHNYPERVDTSCCKMGMCGGDRYVLCDIHEDDETETPWTNVKNLADLVDVMNVLRACHGRDENPHVIGEGPCAMLVHMASSLARGVSKKVSVHKTFLGVVGLGLAAMAALGASTWAGSKLHPWHIGFSRLRPLV
jgi:hypothetical protein